MNYVQALSPTALLVVPRLSAQNASKASSWTAVDVRPNLSVTWRTATYAMLLTLLSARVVSESTSWLLMDLPVLNQPVPIICPLMDKFVHVLMDFSTQELLVKPACKTVSFAHLLMTVL